MNVRSQLHFPDYRELLQGCASYVEYEHRDAMYKLALRLVSQANWRCEELAEGLGVLLLTWNAAFYTRYNSFNFDHLEEFIDKNSNIHKEYSQRSILSYSGIDDAVTRRLFGELVEATKAVKKGAKTPVGTAKALHLLAPRIFSIWDTKIADNYGVYWSQGPQDAPQLYVEFQKMSLKTANKVLESYENEHGVAQEIALDQLVNSLYPRVATAIYNIKQPAKKSLIKMIDEYNYAKYTVESDLGKYRDLVSTILSP